MKYFLVVSVLFLTGCLGKNPLKTGMEGKSLPMFSLQMPDSTTWISSSEIQRGTPSVYFLFSVYCPHCKSQLSKILDNIELLKGINIYMITRESLTEMRNYYQSTGLNKYRNIKVGRDTLGVLGQYLGVKGIPYLALYDREKLLSRAYCGSVSAGTIRSALLEE